MGKWKKHSVSQLPAHSPDGLECALCTSKAAFIFFLSVFVFSFSETKRFSTINDDDDIQKKYTNEAKTLAHASRDGSGRRRTSGCAPRAYLTTKWNGNIGMCVALFSAFLFHSCAAFQLNILTSLTFPTETVVPVAERHFPISSAVYVHAVVAVGCSIFFFSNLHSFTRSLCILCIFTC